MGKNRDLIERAQFSNEEWCRLKGIYNERMEAGLTQLRGEALPSAISNGIAGIYEYYKKYVDV